MSEVTLSEAATRFLATVNGASRQRAIAEINRFTKWYGEDKRTSQMSGHEVSLYADVMGPAQNDTSKRADEVRSFLQYLKKEGLAATNLGTHLRLKKSSKSAGSKAKTPARTVELTEDGIKALETELESLKHQRLEVREAIKLAMLDKDFRENSPLDAAKDKQGHLEARIREIDEMLKQAVVADGSSGDRVAVGATVRVTNLGSGAEILYSIVGPTEANVAAGKISSDSPVGKALINRSPGDEVEVSAPAGSLRFRIEEIKS
jgi:transcription elongation factor GreA